MKERAVNEVFGKEFAQLDAAAQALVLQMLGYMEKKCVAIPIKAAKEAAQKSRLFAARHNEGAGAGAVSKA